jgi:6-phosphogluconolactonase (cycloisomerase 2 family)
MHVVTFLKRLSGAVVVSVVGFMMLSSASAQSDSPGAVYTMTNAVPNAVMVYDRSASGLLTPAGEFAAGGNGTGKGLGNQGAVTLSLNGRWLFVVNAGSNNVSVFDVLRHGLRLVDLASSGGTMPISVTVHRNLVYVLNAGSPNNITGFTLTNDGKLTPLAGSTRALSSGLAGPAQVQFSPDGNLLVVTEKATNIIDVFPIDNNGLPGGRVSTGSAGPTPFGFSFGLRDQIFVSEAFGGAAGASAVSSYIANSDGTLTLVSGSVPTTETAACWVVVTRNGRFAYTTNTDSGSISGYQISHDGRLRLLDTDGRTAFIGDGSAPIDLALSLDNVLYSLSSGDHRISAFQVLTDGSLAPLGSVPAPTSANGLAAR